MSQTTRDKSFKDRLPNGNYLENTANHYVVVLGESPQTALISMKATQLKIGRKWNSIMMGLKLNGKNGLFTPPTYSHIYNLKTVQMSTTKEHGLDGKCLKLVRYKIKVFIKLQNLLLTKLAKVQLKLNMDLTNQNLIHHTNS